MKPGASREADAPGESPVVIIEEGSVGIVGTRSLTLEEGTPVDETGRVLRVDEVIDGSVDDTFRDATRRYDVSHCPLLFVSNVPV